jgi:hypothetical protein
MSEEILKHEKSIKLFKASESFRKFELKVKLNRLHQQLYNGPFLDPNTRTALNHLKKLHKQDIEEKIVTIKQLNEDRQSTMAILVRSFERVKAITKEVSICGSLLVCSTHEYI